MDLNTIDPQASLIDAWCRVESGAITESLVEEFVDGVRARRPIRLADIEKRGHPLDWYVRVTKIERANIPRYYRRHMKFQLVRNADATASIWVKEEAKMPTIAFFLQKVRNDGVRKYVDMDGYGRGLFRTLLTTSIDNSLSRFVKSRGYDSLAAAFGYIGSHIEKYDTEGKRVRYLASETWARYEWYVSSVANDLLPFPSVADDILNHFPRLVWEDTPPATEAVVEDTPVAEDEVPVTDETDAAEAVAVPTEQDTTTEPVAENTSDPVTEPATDADTVTGDPVPPTETSAGA